MFLNFRGAAHLRPFMEYNMSIGLFVISYIEVVLIYIFTLVSRSNQNCQQCRLIFNFFFISPLTFNFSDARRFLASQIQDFMPRFHNGCDPFHVLHKWKIIYGYGERRMNTQVDIRLKIFNLFIFYEYVTVRYVQRICIQYSLVLFATFE